MLITHSNRCFFNFVFLNFRRNSAVLLISCFLYELLHRYRASSTSLETAAQGHNHNAFPVYTYPLWASTATQGGFTTTQSMLVSSGAQFQSAYQAYMISYNN